MKVETLKDLHELGASYWRACVLHTAVKLGLFTQIGDESLNSAQIAARIDTEPRATGLFLNAVSALGLLEKEGDLYKNSPLARERLDERSPDFQGNIIYHFSHMYNDWGRLEEAVRSGKSIVKREDRDEERTRQFLLGMHNIAVCGAEVLVSRLDFRNYRSLLDVGGGPGTYSLSFCKKNSNLSAVIFDLPSSEKTASEKIEFHGMNGRVSFLAGDFLKDSLPEGPFDVVFMSQILHSNSSDQCALLIKKVYPVLKPGGEIIVQEFILDDGKTRPEFAATFALNMLINTPHGRTFSYAEIKEWMEDAGFADVEQLFFDLPSDASLVRAHKPRR
ncbi:MAG: methyltransferase [Syntrophobacteraceae bacterium]